MERMSVEDFLEFLNTLGVLRNTTYEVSPSIVDLTPVLGVDASIEEAEEFVGSFIRPFLRDGVVAEVGRFVPYPHKVSVALYEEGYTDDKEIVDG